MPDIPSHPHSYDFSVINFYLNLGILVVLPLLVWGIKSWLSGLVNRDLCSAMQTRCQKDLDLRMREQFMDKEVSENKNSDLDDRISCLEQKFNEIKDDNAQAHASIIEKIMENRNQVTQDISELRTLIIRALYHKGNRS